MATKAEKIENAIERTGAKLHHAELLIAGLAPNPAEWEFTGDVVDAGPGATSRMNCPKCACGTPIRFQYHLARARDGKQSIVGSSCITHFDMINPELAARLHAAETNLKAELAAAEKRSKEVASQTEVDTLRAEWKAARDQLESLAERFYHARRRLPHSLWHAIEYRGEPRNAPKYQRACDYIRWYREHAQSCGKIISQVVGEGGLPPVAPPRPVLRAPGWEAVIMSYREDVLESVLWRAQNLMAKNKGVKCWIEAKGFPATKL